MSYLIDNSMIPSTLLKYKGTLLPSEVVPLSAEGCAQFGNMQISVVFTGVISALTIEVFATNDATGVPQWSLIATYLPTQEVNVYSLNLAYRKVYINITNGITGNTINLVTFYAATPLVLATTATMDASITGTEQMALGRTAIVGRGRETDSAIRNVTLTNDASIRVTKGSKLYAFDDSNKLTIQSKFPLVANRLTTRVTAPATSTLVVGSSLTQVGADGGAVGAMSTFFGAPIIDNASIIVIRGSGIFTTASGASRTTRTTFGRVGLGTVGPDLAFWYNTNGVIATVSMTINVGNDSVPNIDVTLDNIVYSLVVTPSHPDYRIGCAAKIVAAFNALDTPWVARQVGDVVIFTSMTFGVAGVTGVSTLDPLFDATMTTIVEGATGSWAHVHSSSFNLNKATWWSSGSYVEYELSMMNGGHNVKLAIVDNATQDLIDVMTFTLAQKLTSSSDYPISAAAYGAGASNALYSASLSTIKGTDPSVASTIFFNVPSAYAFAGDIAYPVAILSKIASSHPNAVIRKIIVVTDQPTRVTIAMSIQSAISGTYSIDSSTTDGNINVYMHTYNPAINPLNFGFTPGPIIVATNRHSSEEFVVNMPLSVSEPITIGLCSSDFVPFAASLLIVVDYY